MTVLSFFLLYILLNTFLFKPLLKFMDDRRARVNAGLEEGKKEKQAKEDNRRALDEELRKTGGEAKTLLADAKAVDEDARSKALAAARDEAAEALKAARQRVSDEEKTAEESVEESMPELVAVLTAGLLGDDGIVSANSGLICDCVAKSGK